MTNTFKEGAERNKALGVWGAVAGSGGAAGVLLGGVLTEYLGWEWVLFVNTPITLFAAFLAPRMLDESLDRQAGSFDIPGAVSVTAGLSILVYALVDAESAGWGSTQTIGLLALAVALLVAFVVIELRTEKPLMPFSIFRLTTLRGSNVAGLLIGMSLFSMFFFISLYLQQVLGYEPLKAGLAYLPLALTIIASAGIASALVTRIGFKPVLVTGLLFVAAGTFWFSNVSAPGGTYLGDVLFPSLLAAIGLGFSFVTSTIGAVIGVRPDQAGLASGLINTSQQVGGALGLAITATIATADHERRVRRRRAQPGDRAHRGLPGRVPGVRRLRPAGRVPRGGDDLVEGQPRARGGGAGGRAGGRAGGGLERAVHALFTAPSPGDHSDRPPPPEHLVHERKHNAQGASGGGSGLHGRRHHLPARAGVRAGHTGAVGTRRQASVFALAAGFGLEFVSSVWTGRANGPSTARPQPRPLVNSPM